MNNFDYYCPTHVVFGKGSIAQLSSLINKDKKILVIYGGGSIKRNGVYEQVMNALKGYDVTEFSGIEPNPKYETCMKAVQVIKDKKIDFLLAVGGGSTVDGTKFIAAATKYEGEDPYNMLTKGEPVKAAMPFGAVITLPATGSEMNCNSVVSRLSTGEKLAFASPLIYPTFSIIDPEATFTLPLRQTINGIVDTFVHTIELFCTYNVNTPLQDKWSLSIFKTLTEEGPKVLNDPNNYDVRANLFWCATCGLNYWNSLGCVQDWSTHMIGHELTAFYGIDHGQSLAIVLPRLLQNQFENKKEKIALIGKGVFGLTGSEDEVASRAICEIEKFFNSLGMKTKLADYGIDPEDAAKKVGDRFEERKAIIGERGVIDHKVTREILLKC